MNPSEFAQRIRARYPGAYDSLSDDELTQKVVTKYPVYSSQVKLNTDNSLKGTLLNPLKEGISGLKTLYGSGEQGIARKLASDVSSGARDLQTGFQSGTAKGMIEGLVKGTTKTAARAAGDVAGTVFAPISAGINVATGGLMNKFLEHVQKTTEAGEGPVGEIVSKLADIPWFQKFAVEHPNAGEDFGRALNLVFAKGETGKIEPSTAIARTVEQGRAVLDTPAQIKQSVTSVFKKTPEQIVKKRVEELNKIDGNYATMRKASGFSDDGGLASRQRVAATDILSNAVDENGTIRTKTPDGPVDQYRALTLDKAENVVRNNLEKLGEKVNLDEVKVRLDEAVNKSGLEGADLKIALNKVKREIDGYKLKADENGDVPLTLIHDAKISTTKGINYFTPPEVSTYRKSVASGLRETIEKNSTFNTKEVNAELSKYLQDIAFLERLDGKKVQGGKLGKYFAQISGNIIGGAAGSAVGGPVGAAIGTVLGGEAASRIKGSMLQRSLGGEANMPIEKSPVLQKAILSGQSNSLGNLNQQYKPINTTNTTPILPNPSTGLESTKGPNPQAGSIRNPLASEIPPDDLNTLRDYLDYKSGNYKPSDKESLILESRVANIAKTFKISKSANHNTLEKAIGNYLDKIGFENLFRKKKKNK